MTHISERKQQRMRKARDAHKQQVEWKAFIRQWEIQMQSTRELLGIQQSSKPDIVIDLPYSQEKQNKIDARVALIVAAGFIVAGIIVWAVV